MEDTEELVLPLLTDILEGHQKEEGRLITADHGLETEDPLYLLIVDTIALPTAKV